MAVLTNEQRASIAADLMRAVSATRGTFGAVTRADIVAAAGGIDAWIDANAAALNTAIPQPARAALTAQQKLELFLLVLDRRVKG